MFFFSFVTMSSIQNYPNIHYEQRIDFDKHSTLAKIIETIQNLHFGIYCYNQLRCIKNKL